MKKNIDEMGHVHFLLDKMGLDEMGLDEMAFELAVVIPQYH